MNFLLLQTALAAVKFTPESEKVIRAALGSMLEILKQESFVPLTIREILWGYENPLIELGKSIFEGDNAYPYDEFGLFVGVSIKSIPTDTGINLNTLQGGKGMFFLGFSIDFTIEYVLVPFIAKV